MKPRFVLAMCSLIVAAAPLAAQDDGGNEIIVTAQRLSGPRGVVAIAEKPPVIGLKRQADSAVRNVEIVSDSREEDLRRREVQAMLFAAIDRAKAQGMFVVTGQFEVIEVTRANWQDLFPALAGKATDDEDTDDDDDDDAPPAVFEDDGSTATLRLKLKTKLTGSIAAAQLKISAFAKSIPATGRSLLEQKGGLALTIINPEQYRDEIYRRIAAGAKHAVGFYGEGYGLNVTGLDREIAWKQVSNTEVFLYIPYSFSVAK